MSAPRKAWRLIEDPPADGYRNMAADEALLEACAADGEGFPALRLYSFRPACLSLGFSQEHARSVDLDFCRARGIDVVRRPTGGRAVLHDDEVTYSLVARRVTPPFEGSLLDVYCAVSKGLLAAFQRLGVAAAVSSGAAGTGSPRGSAACFAEPSRHEIASGGTKVAGSSQARRRGAFLQHGSIPLRIDVPLLAGATRGPAASGEGARDGAPETAGPGPTLTGAGLEGLAAVAGRDVGPEDLRAALRAGFEEAFNAHLVRGSMSGPERERAEWLRAHRYLAANWTLRR